MSNVFFIWSGERSQAISLALRDLLRSTVQGVNYFHSDDMEGGALWRYALEEELTSSDFGIVCLTPENRFERWPHFESGLILQAGGKERVVPYLFDLTPANLEPPLGDLQTRQANREDTLRLALQVGQLRETHDEEAVREVFDAYAWEQFRDRIENLPEPEEAGGEDEEEESAEPRRIVSKIDELLERVRRLDKSEAERVAEAVGPTKKISHSGPSDPYGSVASWHWYLATPTHKVAAAEIPDEGFVVDENEDGALIASPVMMRGRKALNVEEVLEEINERGLDPLEIAERLKERGLR